MRVGRPSKLTPELQAKIVAGVRLGAFPSIAARAAGIGSSTFYRWMQAGERGRKRFREFREEVGRAAAEARQAAEWEVRKTNPLAWLRYGPGRSKPGRPGWTDAKEITGEDAGPVQHVVRIVRE